MTFSTLTTNIERTWQKSSRGGRRIQGMILHHAATSSRDAVRSAFQGAREVSANYIIWNKELWGCVDEEEAGWTSASYLDKQSITAEIVNSRVGDPWPVSAETFVTVAKWIADCATRYGFPINDNTILTHQELWTRFGESYPTACPGDLQRRKGELLELARSFQRGAQPAPQPVPKEDKVIPYYREDKKARNGGRTVKPGEGFYLNTTDSSNTWNASNIVGGVGEYDITIPVYATGTPGDSVDVYLLWQNTKAKPSVNSPHFVKRMVFGPTGEIRDEMTCKREVTSGFSVFVRLDAPKSNTGDIKATVLDSRAFLHVKA